MAFLRVREARRKKADAEVRHLLKGRTFASSKRMHQYLRNLANDALTDGPRRKRDGGLTAQFLPTVSPTSREREPKAPETPVIRVYPIHGIWRRLVNDVWQSDHATSGDALSGANPIEDNEVIKE
jgi:hypothetical protein